MTMNSSGVTRSWMPPCHGKYSTSSSAENFLVASDYCHKTGQMMRIQSPGGDVCAGVSWKYHSLGPMTWTDDQGKDADLFGILAPVAVLVEVEVGLAVQSVVTG